MGRNMKKTIKNNINYDIFLILTHKIFICELKIIENLKTIIYLLKFITAAKVK